MFVGSFQAAGAAAPGAWQSRLMAWGQLDRETPTDTTQCKHAVAQYKAGARLHTRSQEPVKAFLTLVERMCPLAAL